MKRKTILDPDRNAVNAVYLNFFGVRIWIETGKTGKFFRNYVLAGRIYAKAKNAENQLLKLQKLVNAIHMD